MKPFILKDETYQVIGLCMEVHKVLGHGFAEIVYRDAIELEALERGICFQREKPFRVFYKGQILPHSFLADFVMFEKIILEVKASERGILNEHIAQTLNYLKVSGCPIGLLINFARHKLEYKRLII